MASSSFTSTLSVCGYACVPKEPDFAPPSKTVSMASCAQRVCKKVQSRITLRQIVMSKLATKTPKTPAEEDWKVKRDYLMKKQVRSVNAKEAYRLQQKEGYVILDVRPEGNFKEEHPAGAMNVEIYRLIKEWTPWDIARRAAFAFFGIFSGTEENPDFLNDIRLKLDKNAKIIVGCSAGGTLKPSPNLADGQQSRSLIAAYLLELDGYKNVLHLEGGLRSWFKEGLPTENTN
eukprot:c10559_g1_i1 orf=497-1192(-)